MLRHVSRSRRHAALALALLAVAGAVGRHVRRPRSRSPSIASNGKVTVAKKPRAHRLALADGDRDALRDRRRPAGRRRRRPVRLPEGRTADVALRASRPNVEAIAGYRPDLVVDLVRPEGALGRARPPRDHGAPPRRREDASRARTSRSASSGMVTGREARRDAARQPDEDEDRRDRRRRAEGQAGPLRLPRARPRPLLGHVEDVHRPGVRGARPEEHRRRGRLASGSGYPQLSAEYVVAASPDLIVLADTVCCGQKPSTVAARPGLGSRSAPCAPARSCAIDDSIASRWGPRLVNFFRAMSSALARLQRVSVTVAAEHAAEVRAARARPRLGVRAPSAFLLCSLVVGVARRAGRPRRRRRARVGRGAAPRPGFTSSLSPTEEAILWEIRVPRVVLAALVGAMLALAGATYQGVFRNPLADPYLLGVAAGRRARGDDRDRVPPGRAARAAAAAGRGVRRAASIAVAAHLRGRPLGAARARRRDARPRRRHRRGVLHRAGRRSSSSRTRRRCRRSTPGSSANIPSTRLDRRRADPPVRRGRGSSVILALRRVVDVLNLGDDEAASLGVDVRRVRLALVVAATLGTAAAVAVTGLIGFVGIIVPHAIRLAHGRRLPGAAAALGRRRRRVPRPRGRGRAHGARAGGDPARRRHGVLRRAVLRARAAHDARRRA